MGRPAARTFVDVSAYHALLYFTDVFHRVTRCIVRTFSRNSSVGFLEHGVALVADRHINTRACGEEGFGCLVDGATVYAEVR